MVGDEVDHWYLLSTYCVADPVLGSLTWTRNLLASQEHCDMDLVISTLYPRDESQRYEVIW